MTCLNATFTETRGWDIRREWKGWNCASLLHRSISATSSLFFLSATLMQYPQRSPANILLQCCLHLPFHKSIYQGLIKTRVCCLARPGLGYRSISLVEPERSLGMELHPASTSASTHRCCPHQQQDLKCAASYLDRQHLCDTPPHTLSSLPGVFRTYSTASILGTYLTCFKNTVF